MRKLILIALFSTLFCFAFSASSPLSQYNKSLKAWQALDACNYSYQTSAYPLNLMIAGYNDYTKVNVVKNTVTRREYKAWIEDIRTGKTTQVLESWVEDSRREIGSHKNTGATAAVTLDVVYQQCRDYLREDPKENQLIFNVDKNGLIKQCGYSPINCADGCFRGWNIDEIKITKRNLRS